MFFNSWADLGRVIVVGVCAYVGLVFFLRFSGKRTLSKMNAFDLVVTVALGSTLATILLSKEVALAEGLTAFALLIGLQFVITWLSARSKAMLAIVKGDPALLFYEGEFIERALVDERVSKEEIYAAIRSQGVAQVDNVLAVVLETDGTFSVLPRVEQTATALQSVANIDRIDAVPDMS